MGQPIVANTGLSHIALRVADVERSIAWYHELLGYEVLTNSHAPTPDRTRSAMGLIGGASLALELLQTPNGRAHTTDTLGVAGISLSVSLSWSASHWAWRLSPSSPPRFAAD